MTKQKQVQAKVKEHLLKGKSITPEQCRRWYRGTRLASAINRLRKELKPKEIITEMMYTNGDTYAKYYLKK